MNPERTGELVQISRRQWHVPVDPAGSGRIRFFARALHGGLGLDSIFGRYIPERERPAFDSIEGGTPSLHTNGRK
ncbi:MAG: hypothetical protein HQK65_14155 [Desulfamplus sp.]|nr:hypothetical protein [Desulfamplus sp.]